MKLNERMLSGEKEDGVELGCTGHHLASGIGRLMIDMELGENETKIMPFEETDERELMDFGMLYMLMEGVLELGKQPWMVNVLKWQLYPHFQEVP